MNVFPNGTRSSDILTRILSGREMKRSFLTEELIQATWGLEGIWSGLRGEEVVPKDRQRCSVP